MKFEYRGPFGVSLETFDDVWIVPVGESPAVSPMKSEAKVVESGREKRNGQHDADRVRPAALTASPQAEEVPMTPSGKSIPSDPLGEVPTIDRARVLQELKLAYDEDGNSLRMWRAIVEAHRALSQHCGACHWFDIHPGPLGSKSAQCSHPSYPLGAVPVPLNGMGHCFRFTVDTRSADTKAGQP